MANRTALKTKRIELKLTQVNIARILGITQPSYCILERRGIRNVDTAVKYARHLGCRPEEILELPPIAGKQ